MLGLRANIALSLSLLAAIAAAAPAPQSNGASCTMPPAKSNMITVGKAVYFITNDAENAVVALPIGKDGMLSKGTVTKTGGAGSNAVNGTTKAPLSPDALLSQSALTVVGSNVFAVNAGSNTLSMLQISAQDPTCLTMIGQPVKIPGEFPNTVSASMKNRLVCVGTTGAIAGVSCTNFSAEQGLGQMDALRSFRIGQTTPPSGPLNTVSHTFFSSDESMLFTTVKGDPTVKNNGFLSVFPIQQSGSMARLSMTEMRSSPNGTAVLFGSAPIPNRPNSIFVTDASFGAAILSLDKSSKATVAHSQAIQGQTATCWVTISPATMSAYVTDVGKNHVVEMSLDDAKIIKELDLSANGDLGLIDLRAAGSFVYALSPGNAMIGGAITVLDVSGGKGSMKQVQHFKLAGIAGANSMGMAVMV
ncbi:hypothetical protein B0J11DRAFT_560807 [Dendryphion nanum]|uniref:3-carboxymuconate cyclase n=1 Tax=Dendryphion nanum TaxID=256645 RepID=A0A9P9DE29_9PLEO|nr:hypothetical protein B0J11DRAFT_560807 [Dendryphion nanum]